MWQLQELEKFIKAHSQDALLDSRTVFVSNPEQRDEIDAIIVEQIWPGVVRALRDVPIVATVGTGSTLKEAICEKRHEYTTRELVFMLEDPKRPIGPYDNVPWYCRGKIECSVLNYMIGFDLMVSLPEDFSIPKMLRLLREPMMQGCPPELTYNHRPHSDSVYVVSFTKGSGAGWGLGTHDEAREHIFAETRKNIKVIQAVYELEKDYKSTTAFNTLRRAIIDAYEAY